MSKPPDDLYRTVFGLPPDPPAEKNSLTSLFGIGGPVIHRGLADLLSPIPPPPAPQPPGTMGLYDLLGPVIPPATKAPTTKPAPPITPGIETLRWMVNSLLKRKATVTAGRVLPSIEDPSVMEGRRIRAAFVYCDLNGFTKLVATQPE